ncbi:MAG: hypothetical protein LBJ87_00655 [bacterium]|jgi:hypothetical protein|nr:hypothetical protein [bacterium]
MTGGETGARLRITSTAELLKAVELGIVDRTEARGMLGLPVKRGRLARAQPREGGRFVKGELVYPLNRFSGPAQQAMLGAQELASADRRAHVDTGDLLLALVRQADGASQRALRHVGIDEDRLAEHLGRLERTEEVVEEGVGTTRPLKAAVEVAFHGVAYPDAVGTWDLLLALARGEGRAREALGQAGTGEAALRAAADQIGTTDEHSSP